MTTCILLLNAGHEATVNLTGNGLLALLEHPDQLAHLRADPRLLPTAVEDLMRFDPPLQLFERTATADVEPGGVTVQEGQKVAALLGAGNRDRRCSPPRTPSTSAAPTTRTSPSAPECTSASAPRWPGWSCRRPSGPCWTARHGWSPGGPARRRPEFVIRGLAELPVVLWPRSFRRTAPPPGAVPRGR